MIYINHDQGLIYSNGDIYSGDWKNDLCHGSCILTFASESDDSSYCGRWMGGRFHGKGRFMAWRK